MAIGFLNQANAVDGCQLTRTAFIALAAAALVTAAALLLSIPTLSDRNAPDVRERNLANDLFRFFDSDYILRRNSP